MPIVTCAASSMTTKSKPPDLENIASTRTAAEEQEATITLAFRSASMSMQKKGRREPLRADKFDEGSSGGDCFCLLLLPELSPQERTN